MNAGAPLSINLDRQVKNIQFRIQQEISITDDEIQRMMEQLNEYKSEIVRKEKILNKIERNISDTQASLDGASKRRAVGRKMQITQMKNDHQEFIQSLRKEQEDEIDDLQEKFQQKLLMFENSSDEQIENKHAQINKEIESLKDEISRNSTTVSRRTKTKDRIKDEGNNQCMIINNNLVIQLRGIIQARNQERADNLRWSKEKLTECVETIEELDSEHERNVEDRKKALQRIDKVYKKEVMKLAQSQDHKLLMLKGHLSEAEKRTRILRRAAHKLEQSNEQQLHETMKEIDMMQIQYENSNMARDMNDAKEKEDEQIQLKEELTKKVKEREEALESIRAENSYIKKRIAQAKHEIRFLSNHAEKETD